MGTRDSFPGAKRPDLETDHTPPFSAEVENGGVIPPLSDMSTWRSTYRIKYTHNFDFNFITNESFVLRGTWGISAILTQVSAKDQEYEKITDVYVRLMGDVRAFITNYLMAASCCSSYK
jgi:hypothetical protein